MNGYLFDEVINEQLEICKNILGKKEKEYAADDDRLHNFKNAAGMMSCNPKEALAGMMAKHTISVYDMCRSGKNYPIELWEEKITDHINYLLLLKAIVKEDYLRGALAEEGSSDINNEVALFREHIGLCATVECEKCPHNVLNQNGIGCEVGLLSEFDHIIEHIKEEHHDNT